jgi:hypothetical protein
MSRVVPTFAVEVIFGAPVARLVQLVSSYALPPLVSRLARVVTEGSRRS